MARMQAQDLPETAARVVAAVRVVVVLILASFRVRLRDSRAEAAAMALMA